MRYRIILEIDCDEPNARANVHNLAREIHDMAVTKWSNPVYLATERVEDKRWPNDK